MKLREYEYLIAIEREGNMTRAAQSLYVSQPSLSRLLASVENELGVQLFEQRGRSMTPTIAGQVYLENAHRIVAMNEQLRHNIRQAAYKREITLAYPMIYSGYITGSVLPALYRDHPEICIRGCIVPQHRIAERLLRQDWPLALGIIADESAQLLTARRIGQQEMVLAVPKGHALESVAKPREGYMFPFICADHLVHTPFLLPLPTSHSGRFAERYFHAHGITPTVVLNSPMTEPLFHSVAAGAGAAILPSIPLRHMQLEGKITYLSLDGSTRQEIGVLFRADHVLSPQEEFLVDTMCRLYA